MVDWLMKELIGWIAAFVLDALTGLVHVLESTAFYTPDVTRLPQAQAILRRLEGPKTPPPPSWRWQKRGLICVGLGFALIFVAAATVDPEDNLLNWITVAASGLLFVTGFALIALGPRADKKEEQRKTTTEAGTS